MNGSQRRWVGAVLLAGAAVVLGGMGRAFGDGPPTFVRVGSYRINPDRILYTSEGNNVIMVYFGDATGSRTITLVDDEARAFRNWLDDHSATATPPKPAAFGLKLKPPAVVPIDFDLERDLVKPIRMTDPLRTPQDEPRVLRRATPATPRH